VDPPEVEPSEVDPLGSEVGSLVDDVPDDGSAVAGSVGEKDIGGSGVGDDVDDSVGEGAVAVGDGDSVAGAWVVGDAAGASDGDAVVATVGDSVGAAVGDSVAAAVDGAVGAGLGDAVGDAVGVGIVPGWSALTISTICLVYASSWGAISPNGTVPASMASA
jgi:hypothetical protein